ncbi:hypothetical protein [Shewanella surugensis]|uniref:VWFA domain-containing protein n=1 Tax=Shewanella surugensis TaxID=212020 RepID=A0ABT0L8W3_9GAMM|nr:hypothetical protein [Shewanella surugensis]MCL1124141.1 hypothetical protein [Shewanella surugensis]
MLHKRYFIGLLLGLILSPLVQAQSTSFFQIVIDRTGSMDQIRQSTGNTRYQDAITQAQSDLGKAIAEAAAQGGILKVAVAAFESNTGFDKRLDFSDPLDAMTELDSLKSLPTGNMTPLADALCHSADELFTQSSVNPYQRNIGFYTDLNENQSSGECSGSDWTAKVIQKFFSGFPAPVFNVTMFATIDELTQSSINTFNLRKALAKNESKAIVENSLFKTANAIANIQDEVTFMTSLAQYSGGSTLGFADAVEDPVLDSGDSDCGIFFPCIAK